MITIEELKEKIKELGYFATEELIYDTFNALTVFANKKINPGQDIFAICLEGPPGAGKTEFAKTYTKLANGIFNENVEMVDYQCDATTGKTELFEDINISAAIRGDANNVNIPGKLIEAINKVNSGKKVVLFIDEYDKAREETDAFLLQFLQSGKINSTQHGDLEIKEEYKANLQVILCKNDMREELSGPLSRRIRIIRLDYMKPEIFFQVAKRVLIDEAEEKVNEGLLNLVILMYQNVYDRREIYNRLPSCSEMLIGILDADRLLKMANAPQHIVYNTIVKNMFKSLDDIKTFESGINNKSGDLELSNLIQAMKETKQEEQTVDINSLIAQNVFANESTRLIEKAQEMSNLINEYKAKFKEMEEKRQQVIDKEVRKILLESGKLISTTDYPNIIKNFEDESAYVKRGVNILELSHSDWTDVATVRIPDLSHHFFVEKLTENASKLGIKIYENGILLQSFGELNLIVINDLDDQNRSRYRIMSSQPVIPATYLSDVKNFISFATEIYNVQPKTVKQIVESIDCKDGVFSINSLVYSDSCINYDLAKENVYNVSLRGSIDDLSKLNQLISNSSCDDINSSVNASREIMNADRKVLAYE